MTFLHYEYPNGNKMTPSGRPSGATAPTESAEASERVLTCLMVLDDDDDLHAVDLLNFWQEHKRLYPLFFRAAMDVLPTQASTVPYGRDEKENRGRDTIAGEGKRSAYIYTRGKDTIFETSSPYSFFD
ncbi:hypothetical protein D9619_010432 [Psilocybe cf. subviscida]|uniref:HAT C-terminal dimerisation domain-containing protein n=1 Tax=Psilocybe cf. subviscida TaxID=2480587 RepID=A0A8H5ERZ5_9AGAR|nr:hypothetical protein D9619_010432 [Psilocybe cf. subviscida]